MKTLSCIYGTEEEITIGREYYFGQLWDGNHDGQELLESGAIAVYDGDGEFEVYDFEIVERAEDILQTKVKIL